MVWNEGGVLTFLLGQRMKCQVYFSEDRANIDVDNKWEQSSWQVLAWNFECLCFMLMPGKASKFRD